ncbi:hypothetical protein [Rhodospirillum centenum]|uniref:Uncharacterized protein n=1 Tax=Rhodospirillum centenum (strain ATCC 51521 / SW) TaxID=414684 RepID=B6IQU2_RHOCS|nr:hypothetical protein [Rhodospirillum centenum]ACI97828.1 hypothetical protein RC1_0388 [Rhodospirillum centenum SW]
MAILHRIGRLADNTWAHILVAAAMVLASLMELKEVLVTDLADLQGEHGMLLFGIQQLLLTLPKAAEAARHTREGAKTIRRTLRKDPSGDSSPGGPSPGGPSPPGPP